MRIKWWQNLQNTLLVQTMQNQLSKIEFYEENDLFEDDENVKDSAEFR